MTQNLQSVPGSFRDPLSSVLIDGDRVVRVFNEKGAEDLDATLPFIKQLVAAGLLVDTVESDEPLEGYARSLEHPLLELISFPYEWSFTMLRDAALVQLDIIERGLAQGIASKDATAYNVQFVGTSPVFIDAGSFEPRNDSDPWFGYQQFCEMFLFPLMLKAYVGVNFQPFLRGSVHGIPLDQARGLLGGIRPKLQRGRLTHVVLHEFAQRKFLDSTETVVDQTAAAGMSTDVVKATIAKTKKLVASFEHPDDSSTWSEYSDRSHYHDASLRQKQAFVGKVLTERERWGQVWDFGCNDGLFSRQAAEVADLVVAVDADELVVDRLYQRLSTEGPANITPLLVDLSESGGGIGWRGTERPGIFERSSIDLGLYLAVIHHMAITFNVPLAKQIDMLADSVDHLVIEFPHRDDPMVETLLRNKRPGIYDLYDLPVFEAELRRRFDVLGSELIETGTRTIFHAVARS